MKFMFFPLIFDALQYRCVVLTLLFPIRFYIEAAAKIIKGKKTVYYGVGVAMGSTKKERD
jgi:hypothetical protein